MRVLILLAVSSAVVATLAEERTINRIVGGENATIEQYPFMANLQWQTLAGNWNFLCGGSLVTEDAVLTAAHCVESRLVAARWRAVVGSTDYTDGTAHTVSRVISHELYNGNTLDNDVAVLRLETPVTLSASVGVARIAGPGYSVADGDPVFSVGWGHTTYLGSSSDTLMHVQTEKINFETCRQRYAFLKTQPFYSLWPDVTENMVCAGLLDVGGKDACQGDSGGPLLHNGDVIYGVTSWGFQCADAFYPGVNALVPKFADWILVHATSRV